MDSVDISLGGDGTDRHTETQTGRQTRRGSYRGGAHLKQQNSFKGYLKPQLRLS